MNKWIKLALVYLGGTLIGLSQLKIVPIVEPLAKHLNVSLTQMSLLTSIFTVSGIFIALPGGILVTKLGPRKLLLLIIGLLSLGNFIGALVTSFPLLLISRVIEGISFSTITMTAVVLISSWFKDSPQHGTAIGIFTTFPAMASLIAMNSFAPLSERFGYFASWYLIGILALLLVVIYYFTIEETGDLDTAEDEKESGSGLFMEVIRDGKIWLLAVLQGSMAFVLYAFIAIYPLLYIDFYGLSTATANFYASLFGLFGIPFGVVAGILIDKTKRPKELIFISFLIMALSSIAALYLANSNLRFIVQLFCLSSSCSLASSAVTITVPKTVRHESLIGYSMSFVNLVYYTSIVVGPPLVMNIIEKTTWTNGILVLFVGGVIGVIASLVLIVMKDKAHVS